MGKKEICEKVCTLLDHLELIDRKAKCLEMNTKLDECGLTSFTFIQLIVELEKEFSLHIEDDELQPEHFDTLDKIICFIDAKHNMRKSDGN